MHQVILTNPELETRRQCESLRLYPIYGDTDDDNNNYNNDINNDNNVISQILVGLFARLSTLARDLIA
jgi:hypothetical protein